ncbi:MAG TPA: HD domain-containing protein [Candidatus Eisenbacteria bacterium]|nr:HD domain-containing protein [Candidatus Eisenbacteria bacterium]
MGSAKSLLTSRFDDALALAVQLHRHDLRKGKTTPYVTHLLYVCALVLEDGGDEDEAIAALLHDALEDHPKEVSREELEARFGERVAELVSGCSDTPPGFRGGPKPPWRDRKEFYIHHLREGSPAARRIATADKLANLRDTLADLKVHGDALWKRFNAGRDEQLWYYRSVLAALRDAGDGGNLLLKFQQAVRELSRRTTSARQVPSLADRAARSRSRARARLRRR